MILDKESEYLYNKGMVLQVGNIVSNRTQSLLDGISHLTSLLQKKSQPLKEINLKEFGYKREGTSSNGFQDKIPPDRNPPEKKCKIFFLFF